MFSIFDDDGTLGATDSAPINISINIAELSRNISGIVNEISNGLVARGWKLTSIYGDTDDMLHATVTGSRSDNLSLVASNFERAINAIGYPGTANATAQFATGNSSTNLSSAIAQFDAWLKKNEMSVIVGGMALTIILAVTRKR